MEGYQFAHMEIYSAKGKPAAGPEDHHGKRKNGQRAWTAQQIIDELERLEHASQHVIPGRPAPEIIPGAIGTFQDLRNAQLAAAAMKVSFPYTKKDGTKTTRQRKLRADAATIYASVVSLPVRTEDALADDDLKAESLAVLHEAIEHERGRIEKAGGRLMMAVVHWDEEYLHTHVIALDPERGRVSHLHPGHAAKDIAITESQGRRISKKEINKLGNAAYCDAMRAWQSDFHDAVFKDAGLLRYGPRRERLSRADYQRAKEAAKLRAEDEERREQLEFWDADVSDRAEAVRDLEDALAGERILVTGMKAEAEATTLAANEAIERGKAREVSAEKKERALERGMAAVEAREIDYSPAMKKQEEKLKFGPNAPTEMGARAKLKDAIMPAYGAILRFAKKIAGVRQREEGFERKEAELKRRARILEMERRKAGQAIPATLREIIDVIAKGQDVPNTYTEDAFPDAWALEKGSNLPALDDRLRSATNAHLSGAFSATQDAYLLCEDQPELASRFELGIRVLKLEADQRGLDLESGVHNPDAATVASRATLHTDNPPKPIRVHRRLRERQLVRS